MFEKEQQFDEALLTSKDLEKISLDIFILKKGKTFKIRDCDLEFRLDQTNLEPKAKWFRARCVTPGKDKHGFDNHRITIYTQGTHGYSPFLDFPYVCYFQGDEPSSPFSVISRYDAVTKQPSILDLSNPYKPRRLKTETVQKALEEQGSREFLLESRYGVLKVQIYQVDGPNKFRVFIPSMNIVATVFRTVAGLELQCMFNVGNSLGRLGSFPVEAPNGYLRRPIVSTKQGYFSEGGTWVPTRFRGRCVPCDYQFYHPGNTNEQDT